MTTPATALLSRKPDNAFEWLFAMFVWFAALAIPVALLVLLWPAILVAGMFGVFVFCLTLTAGFVIAAVFLWLFAPLAFLAAALLTGLFSTARSLWR